MQLHLKPLAIAANLTQGAFCRLDEVLMVFGYLFHEFSGLNDPIDNVVKQAVLNSIELRWSKCDQDVFIAAAILNPFVKISPFHRLQIFTNAGIDDLLSRLWRCFYSCAEPVGFMEEIRNYMHGREYYASMATYGQKVAGNALRVVSCPEYI